MAEQNETDGLADGDGSKGDPDGKKSRLLQIQVMKSKNLPEGSNTTISYNFQLKPNKESDEASEADQFTLAGASEPLDESAQGTENKYNFKSEHPLDAIDGVVLKTLITEPFVLNVEGLAAPGKVSIPLTNLVWRPKPTLDDPDEDEFLPEYPGK
jgi:hypothetical protein